MFVIPPTLSQADRKVHAHPASLLCISDDYMILKSLNVNVYSKSDLVPLQIYTTFIQ